MCICSAPDDQGASQTNHRSRQRKNLGVVFALDVADVCARITPPRDVAAAPGISPSIIPGKSPAGREMLCLGLKAGLVWRVSRVVKLWLFGVVSRVVSNAVKKPKARRGGPSPS